MSSSAAHFVVAFIFMMSAQVAVFDFCCVHDGTVLSPSHCSIDLYFSFVMFTFRSFLIFVLLSLSFSSLSKFLLFSTPHIQDKVIKFHECRDGIYYYDTSTNNHSNDSFTSYPLNQITLLQSVNDNKSMFSRKKTEGANDARKSQAAIGFPSTQTFANIIKNNLVCNSNITADDIYRADWLYGPPPPLLQRKSTRKKPNKARIQHVPLPLQVHEAFREVNLHIDFYYVNGLPFLHTKSENINFLIVQSGKQGTHRASNKDFKQ